MERYWSEQPLAFVAVLVGLLLSSGVWVRQQVQILASATGKGVPDDEEEEEDEDDGEDDEEVATDGGANGGEDMGVAAAELEGEAESKKP